jgi:hypothetical protein
MAFERRAIKDRRVFFIPTRFTRRRDVAIRSLGVVGR